MAELAFVRTVEIGRFTADITVPRIRAGQIGNVFVEWSPHPPGPKDLTAADRLQYQVALMEVVNSAL